MKTIGYLYAFGAAVTWGLTYVINQKLLERISPVMLVFLASVPVTLIGIPFVIANPQPFRAALSGGGRAGVLVLLAAICTTAVANILITSSIKLLDAPTAAIFEIIYPFFVVAFSVLFLGATTNWFFALGAAFIFLGSYVIMRFA